MDVREIIARATCGSDAVYDEAGIVRAAHLSAADAALAALAEAGYVVVPKQPAWQPIEITPAADAYVPGRDGLLRGSLWVSAVPIFTETAFGFDVRWGGLIDTPREHRISGASMSTVPGDSGHFTEMTSIEGARRYGIKYPTVIKVFAYDDYGCCVSAGVSVPPAPAWLLSQIGGVS